MSRSKELTNSEYSEVDDESDSNSHTMEFNSTTVV